MYMFTWKAQNTVATVKSSPNNSFKTKTTPHSCRACSIILILTSALGTAQVSLNIHNVWEIDNDSKGQNDKDNQQKQTANNETYYDIKERRRKGNKLKINL